MFNWRAILPFRFMDHSQATVEILSPALVRVVVSRPRFFHWSPGQCVYVSIPTISGAEAHPFTISNIDGTFGEKPPTNGHFDTSKLVFLIRVKQGFTRRLFESADAGNGTSRNVPVIMDGPYGGPPSHEGYDTVILVAGLRFS